MSAARERKASKITSSAVAKKHILLINSASVLAGGEKNLLDITRFLIASDEWDVSAIIPHEGALKAALEGIGCRVDVVALPFLARPSSIRALIRIMRRYKVDLVHAHGTRAAFYARPAARLAGIPCIYTVHGIHYLHYSPVKRFAYVALDRLMRRWTAKTIFVCESDLRKGVDVGISSPRQSIVIHNGIRLPAAFAPDTGSLRRDLGIKGTEKLVLSVGRFHRQKGQSYLVEAAAKIATRRRDVRFLFVGDGPTLDRVKGQAERLDLGKRVVFAGARDDAHRLISGADIFVLPSLWEGLPYVLLEAALARVPVVAHDVDGVSEVIVDGQTGLLVEAGDTTALAQAIERLLDDEQLARTLADGAEERVLRIFSEIDMTKKTVSVYDEALAARRQRPSAKTTG